MHAIELKDLKKYYGSTKAVDGVSFTVKKGEIFGFLGPNGAGKTTTIRCMMDFIRPDEGSISIAGMNAQENSTALKQYVGYLSGTVNLYDSWSGDTHIKFFEHLNEGSSIARDLAERLQLNLKTKAGKLSSGNRQKLGLILALMSKPEVLVLDEPTSSLDPLLQNAVYDLLEELRVGGTTVFMSSHNLSEVERLCDRVGIIKQGKIAAVEDVSDLKEKRIYKAIVYFEREVSAAELRENGISVERKLTNGFILNVSGDIRALFKKLELFPVADIEINPASLEDIFMEFYR